MGFKGVALMVRDLEKANASCPYCGCKLRIEVTQPYQDYTYRVEFICTQYRECMEAGIVMLMEVKA